MIQLIDVSKTFHSKNGTVHAIRDVNLEIEKSDIFGVIGYSGAGKSTLVRCINLLEYPTSGKILLEGIDLTALGEKALRRQRQKIGMIFQQFNLFASRTVFENVVFPLKYKGLKKREMKEKVFSLLELVGISDKSRAYPAQLSGGQKQRVAIARALANDPGILLCDEATSALDPQTTQSILKLLKDLNRKLGLTIVLITHEMSVIKEVCNRVAVMDKGRIVEQNDVFSIFSSPQMQITKDFIRKTSNLSRIDELMEEKSSIVQLKDGERLCRLDFYGAHTKEAMISWISREYQVEASIIFANVEVLSDTVLGSLIVILSGSAANQNSAVRFLTDHDIRVEVMKSA